MGIKFHSKIAQYSCFIRIYKKLNKFLIGFSYRFLNVPKCISKMGLHKKIILLCNSLQKAKKFSTKCDWIPAHMLAQATILRQQPQVESYFIYYLL